MNKNILGYCVLVKNHQKDKSDTPYLFVLKSKEEAKRYEKALRFLDNVAPIEVYKEKLWELKQKCCLFLNNVDLSKIEKQEKYYIYQSQDKTYLLLNIYPIDLMEFEY